METKLCRFGFTAIMLCFAQISFAQSNCKYISALLYIKSNTEIIASAKKYLKISKEESRGSDFYKVSPYVSYIPVTEFAEQLKGEGVLEDSVFENNAFKFNKSNYFPAYVDPTLLKLSNASRAKLYLSFSKPVSNFLIAEFGRSDPKSRKQGKALQVFLVFDSEGLVTKAFFAVVSYE